MAIDTEPRQIRRSCENLTRPDPRLNTSQILAWAICWPWDLLWSVFVNNPIRYLAVFLVREFQSLLEGISSGRFRDIEAELTDKSPAPPMTPQSDVATGGRGSVMVADPLPDWRTARPTANFGHQEESAPIRRDQSAAAPYANETAMSVSAPMSASVPAAIPHSDMPCVSSFRAPSVADLRMSHQSPFSAVTNAGSTANDVTPVTAPNVASSDHGVSIPAIYPTGKPATPLPVSPTPLRSGRVQTTDTQHTSTPSTAANSGPWNGMPPGHSDRHSPPLN